MESDHQRQRERALGRYRKHLSHLEQNLPVAGLAKEESLPLRTAQHNPNAMLRDFVTVQQVIDSPIVASPLHRRDCCVISDGGGALVVVAPEVMKGLKRPRVKVIGAGEAPKGQLGGDVDLAFSRARRTGPRAVAEAGVAPADIRYASIYDSFTITALMQIEVLGFCAKDQGGRFVADRNLISGVGKLPYNTEGGAALPMFTPA